MKPGKQSLLHDLLNHPAADRRHNALLAGKRLLRRKRYTRYATRAFALIGIIIFATLSLSHKPTPPPTFSTIISPQPAIPSLTDDQLLALFPDTPVGLATIGGKKVLIFPRPEDEQRFIGRF